MIFGNSKQGHDMARLQLLLAVTALFATGFATSADREHPRVQPDGKRLFERHCVACHGTTPDYMYGVPPGTQALTAKYKGALPGALEERTDLPAELVMFVIRRGTEAMPFFRKTEISDVEAKAIAAYLARSK
jgi:mono/diheme cytochrome c family protein